MARMQIRYNEVVVEERKRFIDKVERKEGWR